VVVFYGTTCVPMTVRHIIFCFGHCWTGAEEVVERTCSCSPCWKEIAETAAEARQSTADD